MSSLLQTEERLQSLKDEGFDRSSTDANGATIRVRCSQCEALVLNGVACHEIGCPNRHKKKRVEDFDV